MDIYDRAHELARDIKDSEMCREYARLHQLANEDETNRVLLKEYKKLQMQLQMHAVGGLDKVPEEQMQRFQQLASLLYMNADIQQYLLMEMKVQKMLADVIKIVTDASGMQLELPEQ